VVRNGGENESVPREKIKDDDFRIAMIELLQYRTWALAENYFNRMYPVVADAMMRGHNLIKKKTIEDFHAQIEALAANIDPSTDKIRITYDWNTGKEILPTVKTGGQRIVLIPVMGALTKAGDACSYGMQDYQRFMNLAMIDEQIHGVVFIMDTPGGTVDGTPEFGLAIKNAVKPVGVFGDHQVASAGMWIASQADVIVGNKNNPTEFGSIGVLMVNQDWSNVIESGRAPKMTIIRAPGSEDKALVNPLEPMSEDLLAAVKEDLRSIRNDFVSTVKAGRGDKLKGTTNLFSGAMFDVQKSKDEGLIDSIGTLSTAINKVAELARQRNKEGKPGASASSANTMKFKFLSTVFSGEAWNKVLSIFADDQKTLEASEKTLADAAAENQRLMTQNEEHVKKIAELTSSVSDLQSQVSTLTGEKTKLTEEKTALQTKLDAKPAGHATTVHTTGDPDGSTPRKLNSWEKKAARKVGSIN
jgi:protease-4